MGKVGLHDIGNQKPDSLVWDGFLIFDRVDPPAFPGRSGIEEFAPSRGRVEQPLRSAEPFAYQWRDCLPRMIAPSLVNIPKSVLVEPLIIDHSNYFPVAPVKVAVSNVF